MTLVEHSSYQQQANRDAGIPSRNAPLVTEQRWHPKTSYELLPSQSFRHRCSVPRLVRKEVRFGTAVSDVLGRWSRAALGRSGLRSTVANGSPSELIREKAMPRGNTPLLSETHAATMDDLLDALEACVAPHAAVVDLEEYRWLKAARLAVKAWNEAQLMHATAQLAMAMQKDGAVQSERVRHLIAEFQRFGERTGRAPRRTG